MAEDKLDKALKEARPPELRRALDDARFVLNMLETDYDAAKSLVDHLRVALSNQRDVVTRLERVLAGVEGS